jgi:putative Mg2+ transporter-C (MgtC) family protein
MRGLTTAAVVWVAAAVGAACGAGLPVLAAVVTAAHFVVAYGYPPLLRLIGGTQAATAGIRVRYVDGQGVLRDVLHAATHRGFSVHDVNTETGGDSTVDLVMRVSGRTSPEDLLTALAQLEGVRSVGTLESDE